MNTPSLKDQATGIVMRATMNPGEDIPFRNGNVRYYRLAEVWVIACDEGGECARGTFDLAVKEVRNLMRRRKHRQKR